MVPYTFPLDGEYEIQIRLTRDRDENVEGLSEAARSRAAAGSGARAGVHGEAAAAQAGPNRAPPTKVDQHLKIRVPVTAGPHVLGVTFLKKPSLLLETTRQPYQAHFNSYRHPRIQPAIYSVSIIGPYAAKGPGDTPSRRRIFVSRPASPAQEDRCARQILSTLMRRAYRRPVTDADLQGPLALYRNARADGDFDAGIEMALSAVLVSPQFLFRVEHDPAGRRAEHGLSRQRSGARVAALVLPLEQHSGRRTARRGGAREAPRAGRARAAGAAHAGRRPLAGARDATSPRSGCTCAISTRSRRTCGCFRTSTTTSGRPFAQETELFVDSILREDRSVLDLLSANYTFVNERLAKHYGIPNVYGSRFRRVALDEDSWRGGLLRQGSILTVTSYATRTSPVLRGKWILDNILGMPPPPPLPNVPALKDNTVDGSLSVPRATGRAPRATRSARACHNLMDPVGLSLEKFDAVGRRRTVEDGAADRCLRRASRRQPVRRCRRARSGVAAPAGTVRRHFDRKAADLRARAEASSTTTRPRSARSCATRGRRISASRRSFSES